MAKAAYLTIDDGPSERFTDLVDFLHARKVPALLFNRGDMMEQRPDMVIDAIKKGFVIGNHAYSHKRASRFSVEEGRAEILRTDQIIDDLYACANVKRPAKYFRFPYMDRGMGPWFVEPDGLKEEYKDAHRNLLASGLGHVPDVPGMCLIDKKRKLQSALRDLGYVAVPFEGVCIPWYAETEMVGAIDCLCTYSTSDWAVSARHAGKHGFNNAGDLKKKIDNDETLHDESSSHIILAHDQAEIFDVTTALVDHFLKQDFVFKNF